MSAPLDDVFRRQRAAFQSAPFPDAATRQRALATLAEVVKANQGGLAAAVAQDFGHRPAAETALLEIVPILGHIAHLRRHLGSWMKPSRRRPDPLLAGNAAWVQYQPKGVVGIIVPWNYPLYLALGPLATGLAAGNRAIVKMSEYTPATAERLAAVLAEAFPADEVAVFGGGVEQAEALTALPLDHLVFTGSTRVGKLVMRAAAENLVPVTLELGGKSPAIVAGSYDVATAARRVAHGKLVNAGQTCVAPDYALVPRDKMDAFVAGLGDAVRRMEGGDPLSGRSFVIDDRHRARLERLVADAVSGGARLQVMGAQEQGRLMPLHVLTGVRDDMAVMQEEIFGPILPIVPYDSLADAIAYVQARPRPLALYLFSHDDGERDTLLRSTHSGGVTVNYWGAHVINHALPFGGVGASGIGSYHGFEGFRELSHARAVLHVRRWFPVELMHPPYGWLQKRVVGWLTRK